MAERLNIYFACAIRGEQGGKEEKELVVKTLKGLGHNVLSEIFLGQDVNKNDLRELTPPEIFDRDIDWIEQSDAVVADVSRLSMGVGIELGWALNRGKKIVVLCHNDRFDGLTNMVKGMADSKYAKPGQVSINTWPGVNHPEKVRDILERELGDTKVNNLRKNESQKYG